MPVPNGVGGGVSLPQVGVEHVGGIIAVADFHREHENASNLL